MWASKSGWRRERGISLCVTLPSRGFLFAFGLKEEHLSRCRVFVCDKKRQNFVTMERAKGRWCSNLGKSFVGHEAGEEGLRINRPSGERLLTFQNT